MSASAKVIPIPEREPKSPRAALWADRELREVGLIRASDGALLDNRDGFYDHFPDPIATYDTRTHTTISRSLLAKLLDWWERGQ